MANIVSSDFLATFFKKDIRTIQLWAKNGMPKMGRDEYEFVDVVKWRIEFLEEKISEFEKGDETLYKLKQDDQRLRNAERELRLKKILRELLDAKATDMAWTSETTLFRKNADSLKANLDVALIGLIPEEKRNEGREIIRSEVNKYLNLLGELKIENADENDMINYLDEEI